MNRTAKDRTVCVDFDDTLMDKHNVAPGHKMGYPERGAVEAINELYKTHTIVILTARRRTEHRIVAQWLQYFGIPFDQVTNIKPDAEVYIDNRGLRYDNNWFQIVNEIMPVLDEDPETDVV